MDCKVTTSRRRQRAASLVEMVMVMAVGVIVAGAVMAFSLYNARSLAALMNWLDLDQSNRLALDQMSRDIRQANRVTFFGTNTVTFQDADGQPLTYSYNPGARTLTRSKGQTSTVLLREIEALTFTMMQRNIIEGTLDNYPTDNVDECKLLDVSWHCSRSVLGQKSSLSGGQSTRLVIRKQ